VKSDHWWFRWRRLAVAAVWLGLAAATLVGVLGLAERWAAPGVISVLGVVAALAVYEDHRTNVTQSAGRGGWVLQLAVALVLAGVMGLLAAREFVAGR